MSWDPEPVITWALAEAAQSIPTDSHPEAASPAARSGDDPTAPGSATGQAGGQPAPSS